MLHCLRTHLRDHLCFAWWRKLIGLCDFRSPEKRFRCSSSLRGRESDRSAALEVPTQFGSGRTASSLKIRSSNHSSFIMNFPTLVTGQSARSSRELPSIAPQKIGPRVCIRFNTCTRLRRFDLVPIVFCALETVSWISGGPCHRHRRLPIESATVEDNQGGFHGRNT